MSELDANVLRLRSLLRSIFPWRQRQGLRAVASLGAFAVRLLPDVLPHLNSSFGAHRALALEALQAGGTDGLELLLIMSGEQSRRGKRVRAWMDRRGFGISECLELMKSGTAVARSRAGKRIIAEAESNPDALVDAFVIQTLRYRASSNQPHMAVEGALFASFMSVVESGGRKVLESLRRYLADPRVEVRMAVYTAWSRSSIGRGLLLRYGTAELDAKAQELIVDGLSRLSKAQRVELISKLSSRDDEACKLALRVMHHSAAAYADALPRISELLTSSSRDIAAWTAQVVLELSRKLRIDEEYRFGRRQLLPYGIGNSAELGLRRAFGGSMVVLCADAANVADRMLAAVAADNADVRRAALFILDIVSISLDKQKQAMISEVLSFARLGEEDELGKRAMEDLVRRLGPPGGGALGFLRAA